MASLKRDLVEGRGPGQPPRSNSSLKILRDPQRKLLAVAREWYQDSALPARGPWLRLDLSYPPVGDKTQGDHDQDHPRRMLGQEGDQHF